MEYFPGLTSLEMLQKIQGDLRSRGLEPEEFRDRIIFMSMFNDIDWTKRGKSEKCISNSDQIKNYAEIFSQNHWTFLGPRDEKKWYGTLSYKPEGKWDSVASSMVHDSQKLSPNIQRYQFVESWYSQKEAKQRHHTI